MQWVSLPFKATYILNVDPVSLSGLICICFLQKDVVLLSKSIVNRKHSGAKHTGKFCELCWVRGDTGQTWRFSGISLIFCLLLSGPAMQISSNQAQKRLRVAPMPVPGVGYSVTMILPQECPATNPNLFLIVLQSQDQGTNIHYTTLLVLFS